MSSKIIFISDNYLCFLSYLANMDIFIGKDECFITRSSDILLTDLKDSLGLLIHY